ncbi:MAG: GTP cyclohydrolase [Bacteroidetes bacterium]|jgi:hypothetical protein|nr:GTP cyclohydrolase [Bacteroidota bacterium]
MYYLNNITKSGILLLLAAFLFAACGTDSSPDDPPIENEEEIITDITLTFTNLDDDSDVVTARAQDPDGDGAEELQVLDDIQLQAGVTYRLTYEIFNGLESPPEDIGEEIEEEADEHQFFFQFTENAFSNPEGDGNFDNADDPINYEDFDNEGNPVGLETTWTTSGETLADGSFRVRLQHQPDIKSSSTTVNDGDTDLDITFTLIIQ